MKTFRSLSTTLLLLLIGIVAVAAQPAPTPLPALRVHAGGHYLESADGRPFFWLGDTAWKLAGRTTRSECSYYLQTRARQGFTVIQFSALLENELAQTNTFGQRAFSDLDPTRPNDAYFDRLAEIVDEAARFGLYVALLPAWGDQLTAPWGDGPRVFRQDNLPVVRSYARYLGQRMKGKSNVVWMLGGDRPARLDGRKPNAWPQTGATAAGFPADYDWTPIWREFAAGISAGTETSPVFLYHPQGGEYRTSQFLTAESWLAIHAMQSGHSGGHDQPVWEWVAADFALSPARPTLDLEPNYEDHPFNPWPRWDPTTGYFRAEDVRRQVYRSVFAGACGVTYGHHAVWQFAGPRYEVINFADRDWVSALHRPGASQMIFLRQLVESRPFFNRIPDPALILGDPGKGGQHLVATRDVAGSYAFVYFPQRDQSARLDLDRLKARRLRAWWYDPRTGFAADQGEFAASGPRDFHSPAHGPDWVLVLDDVAKAYPRPGSAGR